MLTVLFFFIFGCTSKQSDKLTDQQIEQIQSEVKTAYEPFMSGWADLDAYKALQVYSPEVIVGMNTLLLDYNTYKEVWKGIIESTVSIEITPIKEYYIVLTKDFVIGTRSSKVEMLMKSGVKITYNPIRYSDVYKKVGSQWKIIFEQSSGNPIVQPADKK
jgi:ketosteroid isomerase-like protein